MPSSSNTSKIVLGWLSGGGTGLLLGTLIGLSASAVVATVIGGLTSGLALFLGSSQIRKNRDDTTKPDNPGVDPHRLAGFGLLCFVGLMIGLHLRVNDSFAPDLQEKVKQWQELGFAPQAARDIVLFQQNGLILKESTLSITSAEAPHKTPLTEKTILFASEGGGVCRDLNPRDYADARSLAEAFGRREGAWAQAAAIAKNAPEATRMEVLTALWRFQCGS